MDEIIGRAGFHAMHTKASAERAAILHEMMRELDEAAITYWADRNPNIVVADEALNEAYVNDGAGGFERCTEWAEVLKYGAERIERVNRKRKIRADAPNKKTGKIEGGTVTTTMIVAHLPKSMCNEVPGFYPVLDKKGRPKTNADGTPVTRSRWVAKDRDEARQYFNDVVDHLTDRVLPGGQAAVLGLDIQHSESTPHVQILADPFAEHPDDPEACAPTRHAHGSATATSGTKTIVRRSAR